MAVSSVTATSTTQATPARSILAVSSVLDPTPAPSDALAIIAKAKAENPFVLQKKVQRLRQSAAFMDLFKGAPDAVTVQTHLEFYAAISTMETVNRLVRVTRGKHFPFAGTADAPRVELRDGAPPDKNTQRCCSCWRAWVAFWAYFAATSMTCIPVTALSGGLAGVVCGGIFHAIGGLPNFDDAC